MYNGRFDDVVKALESHGIMVRTEDIAFIQRLKDVIMVYVMKGGVVARFYIVDGKVLGPEFLVPRKGVLG